MPQLLRLAVMERDLAVELSRAEAEDEAVDAVLAAAVSYAPDCGLAVFASTGEWDVFRTGGPRSGDACALAMNAFRDYGNSALRGSVVHLPEKRGVSGRLAFVGPCVRPRPALSRIADLLSAALVRIAVERNRNVSARDRALLESELRHRTRNSLSMIKRSISFLVGSLSRASADVLESIDERLGALMSIHDLLDRTSSNALVPAVSYFRQLADALRGITPEGVGTVIAYCDAPESVLLPLDRAATIGLIVHELVMNTIKHAAGTLVRMTVRVSCRSGALLLRYEEVPADEGAASGPLPAESRGAGRPSSGTGLPLIKGLVERARGRRLDEEGGFSSFEACFPID